MSLVKPKAWVCSLQALRQKPQNPATAGPGEGSAPTATAPSMLAAGSCPSDKGRAQARVMLGLLQFQGWQVSETPYVIPTLAAGGCFSLYVLWILSWWLLSPRTPAQVWLPCLALGAQPAPSGVHLPLGCSLH